MEAKIINAHEVGRKFFNYIDGRCYIYSNPLKPERVKISSITVHKDRSYHPRRSMHGCSKGIIGAMLGGVIGLLVTSTSSQPKWDADFDIYLKDGRHLRVNAQSEKLIRYFFKYVD